MSSQWSPKDLRYRQERTCRRWLTTPKLQEEALSDSVQLHSTTHEKFTCCSERAARYARELHYATRAFHNLLFEPYLASQCGSVPRPHNGCGSPPKPKVPSAMRSFLSRSPFSNHSNFLKIGGWLLGIECTGNRKTGADTSSE